MTINELINSYRLRVDNCLDQYLPAIKCSPESLHEAMRYSVLSGGKRIRAILVYLTNELFSDDLSICDPAACAVELIHSYSLIHDDLPAMDDDNLRRGKPTCHIAFDEATAILAGDALHTLAFEILSHQECQSLDSAIQISMIKDLATACGSCGMAGGQALDLISVNEKINFHEITNIHNLKTGKLISASVMLGAKAGSCESAEQLQILKSFSDAIGLAYQIRDDILDVITPSEILGKPQGSDIEADKKTFVSVVGLEESKEHVSDLHAAAIESLKKLNMETCHLESFCDLLIQRTF